jgi:hypothetical protein
MDWRGSLPVRRPSEKRQRCAALHTVCWCTAVACDPPHRLCARPVVRVHHRWRLAVSLLLDVDVCVQAELLALRSDSASMAGRVHSQEQAWVAEVRRGLRCASIMHHVHTVSHPVSHTHTHVRMYTFGVIHRHVQRFVVYPHYRCICCCIGLITSIPAWFADSARPSSCN